MMEFRVDNEPGLIVNKSLQEKQPHAHILVEMELWLFPLKETYDKPIRLGLMFNVNSLASSQHVS